MMFVVGPALMLLLALMVWGTEILLGLLGAPADGLTLDFMGDAFGLLGLVQISVVVILLIPGILCMLSDPVGTRLAMWALGSCLLSLMPRVFCLAEDLGARLDAPSMPVVHNGLRYKFQARPSIPELRFSPGVSPQLE